MPELYVMGDAQFAGGPLLAYGSRDPQMDIFAAGDRMGASGWKINRLQKPDGLHAMVTAQHAKVTGEYLRDLRAAVAAVKADPGLARTGSPATYGMMSHLPLPGLVRSQVLDRFAAMYRVGGAGLDLDAEPAGPQGTVG
ncbi:MAG: hypothetical protein J0L57_05780, partial [Burkholderiales bacterium]|nr:hypothetical protein [Burkholderiales bacterium]